MEYMKELITYLNKHTELYDNGTPEISDKEWDSVYYELKQLEDKTGIILPDSPTHSIHYFSVNELNKVKHSHPMLSLAKTKDWNEFLQYFGNKSVTGMVKLDGLTCSLEYQNGRLIKAETRGNGVIGEDIFHNALVITSIPKNISYLESLIIDGEIICTDKDFAEFADTYANSRNFASGSIRLLDSKECEKRKLTFVAWNIIEGFNEENCFFKKLEALQELGFRTVPWTSSFDLDAKEFLIEQAEEEGYPIDGLVGRFTDVAYGKSLGETDHHSRAAFAFKFYDETYPTELMNIEWTMGRTGILTPVAVFKPIDVDGSVIERASLHNISILRELLGDTPFKGQKINVFKANMIIPQIADAEISNLADWTVDRGYMLNKPTVCPVCGGEVRVIESDSGVLNLCCVNPTCGGKLINRLDHFCSKKGVDIKGLSAATLEKLIDWGWVDSISDIYNLKNYRTEWMQKPGFGPKSVDKILTAIDASTIEASCEAFISALGIPLIGNVQAKELMKYFKTWNAFRDAITEGYDFTKLDGFGESKTNSLLDFDYTEADKLSDIFFCCCLKTAKDEDFIINLTCKDLTFVITGSLNIYKNRADLTAGIEVLGGKVVGSVSKNTSYLINNDKESKSAKNVSAQKLNIPIISEAEFISMFVEK